LYTVKDFDTKISIYITKNILFR